VADCEGGISEAKLLTLVRIRLRGCDSSGKARVADVGRLEERRQALVRVLDQALNLLQSVALGIGLVGVVQRLQQGQIFAGFRRDVLNGQGSRRWSQLARLQACHQRRDV
jgi:hypothetical protein